MCILLWETAHEVVRTTDMATRLTQVRQRRDRTKGWFFLASIVSTVNLFRSKIAITTFTDHLPGTLQRFYLYPFIIGKVLQLSADFESAHDAKDDNETNFYFLKEVNYSLSLFFPPPLDNGTLNTVAFWTTGNVMSMHF